MRYSAFRRNVARRAWRRAVVAATMMSIVATSALVGSSRPSAAQTRVYAECLEAAQTDPARGRERAMQWAAIGGGAEARHCGAIALIGLGAHRMAAEELADIATARNTLSREDRFAALLLAGDLWLSTNASSLAEEAFERAQALGPNEAAPWIGLARAAAARELWADAISHLDSALFAKPDDPEALTLRAAAHRRRGDASSALADATLATATAPTAALAWFERGAAELALGDRVGAEQSWLRAVELDLDGVAGDLARTNLQKLLLAE